MIHPPCQATIGQLRALDVDSPVEWLEAAFDRVVAVTPEPPLWVDGLEHHKRVRQIESVRNAFVYLIVEPA